MRGKRFLTRLLILAVTFTLIVSHYVEVVRPAYLNWGATPEEQSKPLPGDEIVDRAMSQATRAITIAVPPDQVWPWIAQLGQDRGGFYSFDVLENLVGCEMPTVDVLRSDRQSWKLGDKLWMYPSDKAGGAGFATLRAFEPGRVLGFGTRMVGSSLAEPENGSWTYVLEPAGATHTRLLVRGRGSPRHTMLGVAFDWIIFEPIHFAMERRMLIGLAEVAETGVRSRRLNHLHVLLWTVTFGLLVAAKAAVIRREKWIRPLVAFVAAAAVFQVLTLLQPPLLIGALMVVATGFILWPWRRTGAK